MKIVIDIPEEEYKCVQITGCIGNKTCISNAIYTGTPLPMTNSEWIDFLVEQFNISRTSAKDMLHTMILVKREDNFKKLFSGRK